MTALVLAAGISEAMRFISEIPDLVNEAAFFAVTDTGREAEVLVRKKVQSQVNFPKGYLNKDRLSLRRKPTRVSLEAVISGRDRPTSLARFAPGATPQNSRGRPIFVKVKTGGGEEKLKRAFMVRLRNGNMGLAIRLPKGQEPREAYKPVELTRGGGKSEGAWLLYGPSVDQVMRGVVGEASAEVADDLNKNFIRHLNRLLRRG